VPLLISQRQKPEKPSNSTSGDRNQEMGN
jgi:hypothetical protein